MQKLKKRLLLFSSVLLGIFALINLIWVWQVGMKFYKYGQTIEYVDDSGRMEVDGYYYIVKPAGYLSYETGHLSVSQRGFDNDSDICFYYYPRAFGKSYYGIDYFYPITDDSNIGIYFILFDKDFQQLNGDEIAMGEEFQQILDDHQEEILDLMAHAKTMWGLEYK